MRPLLGRRTRSVCVWDMIGIEPWVAEGRETSREVSEIQLKKSALQILLCLGDMLEFETPLCFDAFAGGFGADGHGVFAGREWLAGAGFDDAGGGIEFARDDADAAQTEADACGVEVAECGEVRFQNRAVVGDSLAFEGLGDACRGGGFAQVGLLVPGLYGAVECERLCHVLWASGIPCVAPDAVKWGAVREALPVGGESGCVSGFFHEFEDVGIVAALRVGEGGAFDAQTLLNDLLGVDDFVAQPLFTAFASLWPWVAEIDVRDGVAADFHAFVAELAELLPRDAFAAGADELSVNKACPRVTEFF